MIKWGSAAAKEINEFSWQKNCRDRYDNVGLPKEVRRFFLGMAKNVERNFVRHGKIDTAKIKQEIL